MRRTIFFLSLIAILGLSCFQKWLNHPPYIDFLVSTDYYTVNVKAVAQDDDSISKVIFDWGDNQYDTVKNTDFSAFYLSHDYEKYGVYTIRAVAYDSYGDTTQTTKTVILDDILQNVKPSIYKTNNNELLMLTINLHTYQEDNQQMKFDKLAETIARLNIDIVLMQECAQHRNSPVVYGNIRENNMALIIQKKLKEKYGLDYYFTWDWAHYGWSVYEEGEAVLAKYPITYSGSRVISTSNDVNTITTRKAVFAGVNTPWGLMDIFSAHLHWKQYASDPEPKYQVIRLKNYASEMADSLMPFTTIVGGDFNVSASSDYPWNEAYLKMVEGNLFKDAFLEVYPDANTNNPVYFTVDGVQPGRIDYIFHKNDSHLQPIDGQIIFTDNVIGKVSDHAGVLIKFKVN